MKNIFDKIVSDEVIARIQNLNPDSSAQWGKMTVDQMLAHCNVTYELIYEDKHPKPTGLKKLLLKWFVKNLVVNEKPYKRNNPTAPEFLVTSRRDFEIEQRRLIDYIKKTLELGENYFDGKESHSFGKLKSWEWNNMFYKHLDHHLTQFAV
jgi:hypothetical protein